MRPVLFSFEPFHLYSFGVLVALGVLLSIFLMERRSKTTGFPPGEMVFDLTLMVVVAGFFGARLVFVLENLSWYLHNPLSIFAVWEGGLTFYGGMIAAFLGIIVFARVRKISVLKIFDFLLPYVALAHAFGRLGCFMNGCCGGKACELPWAVRFPGGEARVHPTQLYEAALDTALFLFLSARYDRRLKEGEAPGKTAMEYFFLYGLIRFCVEFFRAGNPYFGPLTEYQWFSLFIMGMSAFFYARRKNARP